MILCANNIDHQYKFCVQSHNFLTRMEGNLRKNRIINMDESI
jgi:hypothetical protein